MNPKYKEIFDSYLRAPKSELKENGRRLFFEICSFYHEKFDDKKKAYDFCLGLFSVYAKADGYVSDSEVELMEYITCGNIGRQALRSTINNYALMHRFEEIQAGVNKYPEIKNKVLKFVLCLIAIDGNIDPTECNLFMFLEMSK